MTDSQKETVVLLQDYVINPEFEELDGEPGTFVFSGDNAREPGTLAAGYINPDGKVDWICG